MHDIHSNGTGAGGGSRLFSGVDDRRLRPHHHNHHQQDLKCPRCESINTKFCYYNNYNLSQPRHFCKSCRRYWTKGGVLRNVPVGGGVRKTKRAKPKSKSSVAHERKSSNSENSSSESSSLNASTTAVNSTAITTATEASGSNSTNSTPTLLNFNESSRSFFSIPQSSNSNTGFNPLNQSSIGSMPSEIGRFSSLITSSTDQMPIGFNIAGDISSLTLHQNANQLQWRHTDVKMGESGSVGFVDHDRTAEIESNGGLAGIEFIHGMFDLTGTVDQSYWNQSQWNVHDNDHQLTYLP